MGRDASFEAAREAVAAASAARESLETILEPGETPARHGGANLGPGGANLGHTPVLRGSGLGAPSVAGLAAALAFRDPEPDTPRDQVQIPLPPNDPFEINDPFVVGP